MTAKDEQVARLKEEFECLDPHTHFCSHILFSLTDLSGEDDMVPPVKQTRYKEARRHQ